MTQDSSQRKTPKQQLAFIAALFEGLQREGYTGVIKIHMHAGGLRAARQEQAIDLDWHA